MINKALTNRIFKIGYKNIHLPKSTKLHFSFICDKNNIISFGHNDGWKTHPLGQKYKCRYSATHAELSAILDFPYKYRTLYQYKMVNIRIKKDGTIGNAKPCIACIDMLKDFGLIDVYYTNNTGVLEKL